MAGDRFDLEPNIKALLHDLGLSPARVLRRAELPADLFAARRPIEFTTAECYRFWDAIEAEVAAGSRADRPRDVTVEIGHAISVEIFSPPIFAALCSPNLATAAERLATYKPLIGPIRLLVDNTSDGELTIRYVWPARPPALLALAELIFWTALARIATREQIRPARVSMPDPPRERSTVEDFLGTRVRAGEDYSITFTPADARRPFLTENEQMWSVFAPDLRQRLSDLTAKASLAERVRAALAQTLPAGDASIAAVTRQLAISPRTLQRRLNEEGTSFQAVLAATREALARHYLTTGELRTSEIGFLLGFDDTNSFYRAFKTWTGTTPDAVRSATSDEQPGQASLKAR